MKRRVALVLACLLALSALVFGQSETFQRWRLAGGTSGALAEIDSTGHLLVSATASASQASPDATTFPRVRLAGGTTGNLAEVDSSGHLLVTGLYAGALVIPSGKTVTVSNTLTLTGTDASSVAFGTGGTVAYTIASGTQALATGAIASGTCATVVTTAATGTATTDVVTIGFNGDPTGVTGYVPLSTGMLTIITYPSSNNINTKVCNNTSASITPGAITLNWRVVR